MTLTYLFAGSYDMLIPPVQKTVKLYLDYGWFIKIVFLLLLMAVRGSQWSSVPKATVFMKFLARCHPAAGRFLAAT